MTGQRFLRYLVAAPLLALGLSVSAAGLPSIPPGDGMGIVDSYDPARRSVMVGKRPILLLPGAAASLERQLVEQGRQLTRPFTAKLSVGQDAAGQPVIESIYVMPPKER
jgi:hypothetical protein